MIGLILFHGAGGDRDHRLFLALEQELDNPVARINFPYRHRGPGRRPPDRMPKLIESVNQAMSECSARWGLLPERIVVGGRSMGGRAASMALAQGLEAAGLLLLSYPLHPPGKPEKLRAEHFADIMCPVMLVQGRRDPFGRPEEFALHLPRIRGPVTELWVDGNHDPKNVDEIVPAVGSWLEDLDRR